MKRLVSMLLVLSMVLAMAGTAMAACKLERGQMVKFKCDSNAYTAPKAGKKTNNVVRAGSQALVRCVKGKYVKLLVNEASNIERWFKACDLEPVDSDILLVLWIKGGHGMSFKKGKIYTDKQLLRGVVRVTAHTNLRKTPSLHRMSAATLEKGTCLKATGRFAADDRKVIWVEVCYKGKKLWVSSFFINLDDYTLAMLYDEIFAEYFV